MKSKQKRKRLIAVIDFETDPFKHGRIPKPFAAGFYDGDRYMQFWGDDCVDSLLAFLSTEEPMLIYAHNGGKFDFFYFVESLSDPIKIIGGRITKAMLGVHELRDSFAIIPVPLSAYQKDETDYSWFERDKREKYRDKILAYLKGDCVYLHELVSAFIERFGPRLTIGGTALKILREMHPFRQQTKEHDEKFREFYFGGRVEALETGIIKGAWKVFDVNSMYPKVMRDYMHPCGRAYASVKTPRLTDEGNLRGFGERMYFITIEGHNFGAFPIREKGKLNFRARYGVFNTTSHELKVALQYGLFRPVKIHRALVPHDQIRFNDYVDRFIVEKIEGKQEGDKVKEIFAKLLLNSAYGKTAQNPENYFDWQIVRHDRPLPDLTGWELYARYVSLSVWRKPADNGIYYDVAIGASITSAARSILMQALAVAKRPIYCDTDSVICLDLPLPQDASALGAWKLEAEGDTAAIAGKKMYALRDGAECVKLASKGVRISDSEIFALCRGESVTWKNAAPTFSLQNGANFLTREVKRG